MMKTLRPLIEQRQYSILKCGLGFMRRRSLREDMTYRSSSERYQYSLLEKIQQRRRTVIDEKFIAQSGVFFPQTKWNTFVSLFESNESVRLVHSLFPGKNLVLHESNEAFYLILRALKDHPQTFIEHYSTLVSVLPKAGDTQQKVSHTYKTVKHMFFEHFGQRSMVGNSASLLFLCHFSEEMNHRGTMNSQERYRGNQFWIDKVETIKEWASMLKKASLHTGDYQQLDIKEDSFVFASCPPITGEETTALEWTGHHQRNFVNYFTSLREQYGDRVSLSSINLLNPTHKKSFGVHSGWSTTVVHPKPVPHKESKNHEVLVTSYDLNGLATPSNQTERIYYGMKVSSLLDFRHSYGRYTTNLI